jgi:hypothetical protein
MRVSFSPDGFRVSRFSSSQKIALARVRQRRELVERVSLLLAVALDLGAEGRGHRVILGFLGAGERLFAMPNKNRAAQVDVMAICSVYIEHQRIAFALIPSSSSLPGLRKGHLDDRHCRLPPQDPDSPACRTTSRPAASPPFLRSTGPSPSPRWSSRWSRPSTACPKAEKQRVILDAGRVAALADEPGQNALAERRAGPRDSFDTLEGPNNRSLWVFLNEPDRFRLAEEVRYNDERRRGRSWSGFECR